MRGVAAIVVTCYHYFGAIGAASPTWPQRLADRGYICVDLFFILSGYLMARTYGPRFMHAPGFATWRDFMLRRFARIYPLYGAALAVCIVAAWLLFHDLRHMHPLFAVNLPHPARDIAFNALLIQGWSLAPSALVPGWSLSTEWAAYFLFPALVWLALGRSRLVVALTVAGAIGLLALVIVIDRHDGLLHGGALDASHGEVPATLLRSLAGFTLGMLTSRIESHRIAGLFRDDRAGLSLLGLLLLAWVSRGPDVLIYALFPPLVLCLAVNRGRVAWLFACWPVYWLGLLSYAIYLLHFQFRALLWILEGTFASHLPNPLATMLAAAFTYAAVIGTAFACYRLIEVPARNLVRAFGRRRAPSDFNNAREAWRSPGS